MAKAADRVLVLEDGKVKVGAVDTALNAHVYGVLQLFYGNFIAFCSCFSSF